MTPARLVRIAWMVTAFYAGFHFVMTHLPPGRLPSPRLPDKTLHFLSYAVMTVCFYAALWLRGIHVRRAAWVVIVCTAAFGAIDELLQAPVGRTPELKDWVADVAAALVTVAGFSIVRLVLTRRARGSNAARPPLAVSQDP